MAAEAEGNKKVRDDVGTKSAGGDDASARILEDSHKDSKLGDRSKDDNKTEDKKEDSSISGESSDSGAGSLAKTSDASGKSDGSEGQNGLDRMRDEVDAALKSSEMAKYLKVAALSAETAAKFGTPVLFDSASDGKMDAALSEAFQANSLKASDSLLEPFGNLSDWNFDPVTIDSTFGSVTELNDVSRRDFGMHQRRVMAEAKIGSQDLKAHEGLKVPDNATVDGAFSLGGDSMQVLRTPEGDTFLKKGDRVFARRNADGSYKLEMNDGSQLDLSLTKGENGEYSLDRMERTRDGRLLQKFSDGVNYIYNYDARGNRTSVDAAADFKDGLTPEQLKSKLDNIRSELGDKGAAGIRFTDQSGEKQRLLLQAHGPDTHSLTNINLRQAQIFHNGREFRLDRHDQLGLAGATKRDERPASGDDPKATESGESGEPRESKEPEIDPRLAELKREVDRRANGDGATVDGVKLEVDENGDAVITRNDPETAEKISETRLPSAKDAPVTMTNESSGETTTIDGDKFQTTDGDGDPILSFDPENGFDAENLHLDDQGLTDLESGWNIDEYGDVYADDGSFVSGNFFAEETLLGGYSSEEYYEHQAISKEASSEVASLGSLALSITRTGNPNAVGVAKTIAAGAINVAGQALASLGNDMLAQIPVLNSKSIAETAYDQAARSERTQTYAMKMGIFDSTRLSEYNRIATLSSTSFTPEEFVRSRIHT